MQKNIFLSHHNLLDVSQTISSELFENRIYPWQVLPDIKDFILDLGKNLSRSEYEEIEESVWVSKSASISSSALISGPTIIDSDSEVRHGAYVRGSVIVGKNCVVGNSTEIKNAVLFNNVQVPHFNYIGDSIIGYRAHLGAGAIISNVKADKTNVVLNLNNEKIETGLRKFGAIIGDYVEIGCNAVLNPGTVIGRNSNVYPTAMIRGVIDCEMIVKASGELVKKSKL